MAPILTALLATIGCDERVVEVAREASDRQAAQNRQMAELQKEVAQGTHELVSSDAAARNEIVAVHRDLQLERRQLSDGWTDLELERRRVDERRQRRITGLAATTALVGALLLTALLGFLWQLLAQAGRSDSLDEELCELVLTQLLPEDTPELPAPPRLAEPQPPALPAKSLES